jgi:hypothetical protein
MESLQRFIEVSQELFVALSSSDCLQGFRKWIVVVVTIDVLCDVILDLCRSRRGWQHSSQGQTLPVADSRDLTIVVLACTP